MMSEAQKMGMSEVFKNFIKEISQFQEKNNLCSLDTDVAGYFQANLSTLFSILYQEKALNVLIELTSIENEKMKEADAEKNPERYAIKPDIEKADYFG